MFDEKLMNQAGEHRLMLEGDVGPIEAVLMVPSQRREDMVAVLGHPHSLQGGSMSNKVVTTMARTCRDLGIVSLRFNFRGVGQSEGQYDEGIGESRDMISLIKKLKICFNEPRLLLAGFSFGSYVAYRAALEENCELLISIAPPVHHYDYGLADIHRPWLVIQGTTDEVVPYAEVVKFFESMDNVVRVDFPETSHFFHGKLIELKEVLTTQISQALALG